MSRALAVTAFAAASLALPALAVEPTTLEYIRPDGSKCPDEEEFRALVAARPQKVWWAKEGEQNVRVELAEGKAGWVASFRVRAKDFESREARYPGSSCNEAARSVASGVAVAVGTPKTDPIARPDSFTIENHQTLVVEAPGVLGNDFDDSPPSSWRALLSKAPQQHHAFSLSTNGSFTYDPAVAFDGEDGFEYVVVDSQRKSSVPVRVRLDVRPNPPEPIRITRIEPADAELGERRSITLLGSNLPKNPGLSADAEDVTVEDLGFDFESGRIRARLVVSPNAAPGYRTLTLRDESDPGRTATIAFTVTGLRPHIASVDPSLLRPGEKKTITLRGRNFDADANVEITGGDVEIRRAAVPSADTITLDVEVLREAPEGVRIVHVRNLAGLSESAPHNGITIQRVPSVLPPPPPDFSFFAGTEGGYSYWSGGRNGPDEHYQASAFSGELVAGGDRRLSEAYRLDVLITGYGALKTDRRSYNEEEQAAGKPAEEFVRHRIGATALRAAIHADSEETGVSLGVIVGGFQESGCRHDRTGLRNWSTPLCGDFQQWAAFPTFSLRLGALAGPYATLGFLDGRSVAGSLAHLGAGTALPKDMRAELAVVATTEGVGPRLTMTIPWRRTLYLMPAASGGVLYDTFVITDPGHGSFWFRAGVSVGVASKAP